MEWTYNLAHAFEKCKENGGTQKVWAVDKIRKDGKWGKHFGVGTCAAAYASCTFLQRPQLYEIIHSKVPCSLHLDIEFSKGDGNSVDPALVGAELKEIGVPARMITALTDDYVRIFNSAITDEEMVMAVSLFMPFIRDFINSALGVHLKKEDLTTLSGCRPEKFSLHVICQKIIFDSNVLSMATFVFELCRSLRRKLVAGFMKSVQNETADMPLRRVILRSLMLHRKTHGWGFNNTPVDESIYSRDRQFRCAGSGKQGKPILLLVRKFPALTDKERKGLTPGERLYAHDILCDINMTFNKAVGSLQEFVGTLVGITQPAITGGEPFVVHPSPWFKKHSFDVALRELRFGNYFEKKTDSFAAAMRYEPPDKDKGQENVDPTVKKKREISSHVMKVVPEKLGNARKVLVDDNDEFFDEWKCRRQLRKFHEGDVLYHDSCEVHNGKPEGEPSARVIANNDGNVGLYCFNCQVLCWSIASYDPMLLEFADDERITDCPNDKINQHGRVDIDLNDERSLQAKFLVIDAPPGTGKTELILRYIDQHRDKSILVITFRTALAVYLAQRLGIKSYKSLHKSALVEKEWNPFDPEMSKHLAICLDSIKKLVSVEYDIVILDEAGMTRRHCASPTIADRLDVVYETLEKILRSATKVIICQHELSERDVAFYTSQIGIDATNRDQVRRWKFVKPTPIYPLLHSKDCGTVVASMVSFYKESWNYEKRQSNIPFIVFCSSAKMCQALTALLQHVADDPGKGRIMGIWSDVQDEPWQSKFLMDPNNCCHDADVVLVTSILQAGHSIDAHFKCAFWFLFNSILTHADELQFVQRLRTAGRTDLCMSVAFIEAGASDRKLESYMKLIEVAERIDKSVEYKRTDKGTLQLSVEIDAHARRHETINKHFWLWEKLYKETSVSFKSLDVDNRQAGEVTWTSKACTKWLEQYKNSTCQSVLRFLRKHQYGLRENITVEEIRGMLEDDVYVQVGNELAVAGLIKASKSALSDKFGPSWTVVTQVLKTKEVDLAQLRSLECRLRALASYFDYLKYIDGTPEASVERWHARLQNEKARDINMVVLIAVALSQNLCDSSFPIDVIDTQPSIASLKKIFDGPAPGMNVALNVYFHQVFKCSPGKYFNSRSEAATQRFTVARLMSLVLGRFRLKMKCIKTKKRRKIEGHPDGLVQNQGSRPVCPSRRVCDIFRDTDATEDPTLIMDPIQDEDIYHDLPFLDAIQDKDKGLDHGLLFSDAQSKLYTLDYEYFHDTLILLRCLYSKEQFGEWSTVSYLAAALRKAQAAYALYMGS